MVQTAPTSDADQPHVRGANAVRVIGILLVVQGGWRLYTTINFVVLAFERTINESAIAFAVIMPLVIGLLTVPAGVLLVRRDRSGRVFGLVVCSIALAYQILTFASSLITLYVLVPGRTTNALFWAIPSANTALFLVSIVVIARWRPAQRPSY